MKIVFAHIFVKGRCWNTAHRYGLPDCIDIYNIERVQRSYTKRLPGLKSLSYTKRFLRLNLESLESSRVKADLVLLFKVIHEFVDIDHSAMFDIHCTV